MFLTMREIVQQCISGTLTVLSSHFSVLRNIESITSFDLIYFKFVHDFLLNARSRSGLTGFTSGLTEPEVDLNINFKTST